MADNVTITSGGGASIAADEISGVHHQRVKVEFGADGSATDVSTETPLPTTRRMPNVVRTVVTGAVGETVVWSPSDRFRLMRYRIEADSYVNDGSDRTLLVQLRDGHAGSVLAHHCVPFYSEAGYSTGLVDLFEGFCSGGAGRDLVVYLSYAMAGGTYPGEIHVTVMGTDDATNDDALDLPDSPTPTIVEIEYGSPYGLAHAPNVGEHSVNVTGDNLQAATLTIDGIPATLFTEYDGSTMEFVAPEHSGVGPVDVVLSTANGDVNLPGALTYGAAPTITSVTPDTGLAAAGGDSVTITGTGFDGVAVIAGIVDAVQCNGVSFTSVVVVSDTEITALTPPNDAGSYFVTAISAYGDCVGPAIEYV